MMQLMSHNNPFQFSFLNNAFTATSMKHSQRLTKKEFERLLTTFMAHYPAECAAFHDLVDEDLVSEKDVKTFIVVMGVITSLKAQFCEERDPDELLEIFAKARRTIREITENETNN